MSDFHFRSSNIVARAKNHARLPTELKRYEECDVLLGNIRYQSTDQIDRLQTRDDLRSMRNKEGNKDIQIVLKGSSMGEKFAEECRGFVWVSDLATPTKAKHFPGSWA